MNKGQIYHAARKAGKSDAEANDLAGFSGRTPEHVRLEWSTYVLLRGVTNSWGEGPRELARIIQQSEEELERVEVRMQRDKARADELRRLLKMARLGSAKQSDGAHDAPSDIYFDRMSTGLEEG